MPSAIGRACFMAVGLAFVFAATVAAESPTHGPADLALTFPSPIDGTLQPYRLYLPSSYDGRRPLPLLVALHGTVGNHNTYFNDLTYGAGVYKREAEQRGVAMLCPFGRDSLARPTEWPGVVGLPTEWRGTGELHVLAAIEDVCRRFRIDAERIVCTGQSMGGTGTTYLCSRYPDIFAAGIPLSSTYGHVSLATNLRHVPMLYVQGEKDWPIYAKDGPIPLTKELQRLGYTGSLWMIPGVQHNTMDVSTARVFDWALQHRLVRHPPRITFRAYFPLHGRAYWAEIQAIDRIGWFAEIDARIETSNRIVASIANAKQIALRPESALLNLDEPITLQVNGQSVFTGRCGAAQEIRLVANNGKWTANVVPREVKSRTAPRSHSIGTVDTPPSWEGAAEASLGNWLADAMRDATGADIAICNQSVYLRGVPVEKGQVVDTIALINWMRPMDCSLAVFKLRGADLLEIIESNILDTPKQHRFLVQVSGCRYVFDRQRQPGSRVVETDIQPEREYTVVTESLALTRTDTLRLGGRYGKIPFEHLELTTLSTLWRHITRQGGRIDAKRDGRVQAR